MYMYNIVAMIVLLNISLDSNHNPILIIYNNVTLIINKGGRIPVKSNQPNIGVADAHN